MSDTRPIWLTREQRDVLAFCNPMTFDHDEKRYRSELNYKRACRDMADAWDAAPADAEQAAMDALADEAGYDKDGDWLPELEARHVLRALGCPDK